MSNMAISNDYGYGSAECDNCDEGPFKIQDLKSIRDFGQRVDAGSEVPAGECPECGGLCYAVGKPSNISEPTMKRLERELAESKADLEKLQADRDAYRKAYLRRCTDVRDLKEAVRSLIEIGLK